MGASDINPTNEKHISTMMVKQILRSLSIKDAEVIPDEDGVSVSFSDGTGMYYTHNFAQTVKRAEFVSDMKELHCV